MARFAAGNVAVSDELPVVGVKRLVRDGYHDVVHVHVRVQPGELSQVLGDHNRRRMAWPGAGFTIVTGKPARMGRGGCGRGKAQGGDESQGASRFHSLIPNRSENFFSFGLLEFSLHDLSTALPVPSLEIVATR